MSIEQILKQNQAIEITVNEAIKRAHQSQASLNAVVTFCDVEEQIMQAKENKGGLLRGIPIVLKDNVCTKGIRTTASSRILDNYIPVYDAHIVSRLKAAGAVIIAKSSMDELGMGGTNLSAYSGPVHNPYDFTRMSGGSSGGSAALVGSGVVSMAIGTDTGDSIRKPASFCGVIGVKPTYGRISRYGVIPYASSLDHVGYFVRSVQDAALTLEVLAGRDDRDMTSSFESVPHYLDALSQNPKGKIFGILQNVLDNIDNEEVRSSFNELMTKLEAEGAIIKKINFDEDLLKTILPTYYILANCEATANHSNLDGIRFGVQEAGDSMEEVMIHSRSKGLSSLIRKRFVIGSYGLLVENQEKLFRKAQKIRRLLVENLKMALSECDTIIAPASTNVAPKLADDSLDQLSDKYLIAENHMVLGNFSGYPSMTCPMGYIDGLPIGVNITCRPFEEALMFDLASSIEKATGLIDQIAEVK